MVEVLPLGEPDVLDVRTALRTRPVVDRRNLRADRICHSWYDLPSRNARFQDRVPRAGHAKRGGRRPGSFRPVRAIPRSAGIGVGGGVVVSLLRYRCPTGKIFPRRCVPRSPTLPIDVAVRPPMAHLVRTVLPSSRPRRQEPRRESPPGVTGPQRRRLDGSRRARRHGGMGAADGATDPADSDGAIASTGRPPAVPTVGPGERPRRDGPLDHLAGPLRGRARARSRPPAGRPPVSHRAGTRRSPRR